MKKFTNNYKYVITCLTVLMFLFVSQMAFSQCNPSTGYGMAPAIHTCPTGFGGIPIFTETFDPAPRTFESGTGPYGVFTQDNPPGPGTTGANEVECSAGSDTDSGGTGPECSASGGGAGSGDEFLLLESSSATTGEIHCVTTTAIAIPVPTATLQGPFTLSFWYYMWGAQNVGFLEVNINGMNQFSVTGNQQTGQFDDWLQGSVDMSPYIGTNPTIQFCMSEAGTSFTSDIAFDHVQIFGCAEVCALACSATPLVFNTDPGTCEANITVPNPADNGFCNNDVINDYNDTTDASDTYPLGTTTVTFTSTDDFGNPVSCSVDVTVVDAEFPVISCSAPIVINLGPEECCDIVEWQVLVTDNCLDEPLDITFPNSNCNGGSFTGTSTFNVTATGVFTNIFPDIIDAPSSDMDATVTISSAVDHDFTTEFFDIFLEGTLLGRHGPFPGAQCQFRQSVFMVPEAVIDAAAADGILQFTADQGSGVNPFCPATMDAVTLDVSYTCTPGIVQEILSGECIQVGDYTVPYSYTDDGGNTATCDIRVTVNAFPDATEALTCNQNVNVSYDNECSVLIGADMFLEGGPYSCFLTEYSIYLSNDPQTNINNQILSIPIGEYTVTVVDNASGNSCWGNVTFEDKIAPTIECRDITVNCLELESGFTYDPCGDGISQFTVTLFAPEPPDFLGPGASNFYNIDASSIPAGSTIVDVDFIYQWDDTQGGNDIDDAEVYITDPAGNEEFIANDGYNSSFGCADGPYSVIMDFEEPTPNSCADYLTGGRFQIDLENRNLPNFNGRNPTGNWVVELDNIFTSDAYDIIAVGLEITYDLPPCRGAEDNCGVTTITTGEDVILPGTCATGLNYTVVREWFVEDESGNSASCPQSIFVTRIGLDDIVGNAGEIDENGNFSVNPDPIAPGEIRWPARVVAKLTCGDDTTPQGIYDLCSYYVPDAISTECDQEKGRIDQHNAAVMASFPHFIKQVEVLPGNGCGNYNYLVPIDEEKCNLIFTYSDQELPACSGDCKGNEKVVRTWTVLDWCAAQTDTYEQIIKAADNVAPTFINPIASMGATANPWGCVATAVLPPMETHDNCDDVVTVTVESSNPLVTIIDGVAFNLPKSMDDDGDGTLDGVIFVYVATDCCGNAASHELEVIVTDGTPPVAITQENVVIGLTVSPNQQGDAEGSAKLFVGSIDNGSHDGDCGPVRVALRRPSGAPDCGNIGTAHVTGLNNNVNYFNFAGLPDQLQPDDHDQHDTDDGQFVKFCCEDLTDVDPVSGVRFGIHEVWLGVWDDANMDGIPATLGDNFNESWAYVRVESKLDPVILIPPNAMVECYDDPTDPNVIATVLGSATAGGVCAFEFTEYTDVCGWDQNGDGDFNDSFTMMGEPVNEAYNKACNYGPIVRTWCITGTDICGTQIIIVKSPDDIFDGCIDDPSSSGSIRWPYENAVDAVFDANNGSALGFEEGHLVNPISNPPNINDATQGCYNANGNAGYAEVAKLCEKDFDTTVTWVAENCSLIGHSVDSTTYYFEADACLKIIYEHTVIDWCQYNPNDGTNTGLWTWTVIGKVIDDTAPELTLPDERCYAVEPECTTTVVLTATATDSLSPCPSQWIKWTVIVDMWGDQTGPLGGPADYEYSSFVPENTGQYVFPWPDHNGNGIMDTRLGNGGPWNQFDNLPPGTFATSPGQELALTLPESTQGSKNYHTALWKIYDGCGNVMSYTETFQVIDKKDPTPYCINLSTALMENGAVELWACDFDNGSFDNCTSHDWLRFSFGEDDVPVDSNPNYDADSRCTSRTFTCDDFESSAGGFVEVSMYVWDECGNYDFCIVNLRLVDNQGACDSVGSRGAIAGAIATEDGRSVSQVEVEIMNDVIPEYPATVMTDANGSYAFMDNPMYFDYDVSAIKNDNYLNGVSTLDLVLIQKHILGLNQLDSPYKLIAADVNNDEGVSSIDLIELRKLILGIYLELPNNDSWRFTDSDEEMNASNPWPFAEVIDVDQLDQDMMDENFIGIKVGDVNGSVQLGFDNGISTEGRSSDKITFIMEDKQFEVDQVFDIAVTAENFNDVSGYQFTLAQSKLELISVTGAALNVNSSNFASIDKNITTSWNTDKAVSVNDEVLFTMTVKALVDGSIANAFVMNSNITSAEAYTGESLAVTPVELRNGGNNGTFELYQNEPNPFSSATVIGFNMAENNDATVAIYDVTGKVVKTISGTYPAGYNQITVTKSELNISSGVLYYQLESGEFTATKKLIIIE